MRRQATVGPARPGTGRRTSMETELPGGDASAMKGAQGSQLTRREFLRLAGYGLGGLAIGDPGNPSGRQDSQGGEQLGRVVQRGLELKLRPDPTSRTLDVLPEDAVVTWLREVVASPPAYRWNWRWVETPNGYLYGSMIQPVHNSPNSPMLSLPEADWGQGIWVEVSVPYVDLILDNPPARSPWIKAKLEQGLPPRLYYSQIMWLDRITADGEGQILYRLKEPYGSYGDIFWARGEAFRPMSVEEMEPINPDVEDKRIVVDNSKQTLACFEGETEIYYCTVSTGVKFDPQGQPLERSSTPLGVHPIWRKLVSVHMSGGTTGGGWDLAGVGWTTLFVGNGVAVHSTFWHNNFGVPMSRGCVNARPRDAKWVFRWTNPIVSYFPGDVTVSMPGGTPVEVVET